MASSNTVTFKGNQIIWTINDALGTSGSTSDFAWYSSVAGTSWFPSPTGAATPSSESWWMVSKIQFVPASGAATGSYCELSNYTTGTPLVVWHFLDGEAGKEWNFVPPLKCRPYLGSSTHMGAGVTTGSRWIFTLA